MKKSGRKARAHDTRIPLMMSLRVDAPLPPLPPTVDKTTGMPSSLGAMLNVSLGDCTCAAVGHALQVWSYAADGSILTPPDSDIEALYEAVGGYVPGDPNTDQGAVEQEVLKYWLNNE